MLADYIRGLGKYYFSPSFPFALLVEVKKSLPANFQSAVEFPPSRSKNKQRRSNSGFPPVFGKSHIKKYLQHEINGKDGASPTH